MKKATKQESPRIVETSTPAAQVTPIAAHVQETVGEMMARLEKAKTEAEAAARAPRAVPEKGSAGEYHLIVAGTRTMRGEGAVVALQNALVQTLARLDARGYKVVVHIQDAAGANRILANLVDQLGLPYRVWRPDWVKDGNGAAFRCIERMIPECHGILCVTEPGSKDTSHLRNKGLEAKKYVQTRLVVDGQLQDPTPIPRQGGRVQATA